MIRSMRSIERGEAKEGQSDVERTSIFAARRSKARHARRGRREREKSYSVISGIAWPCFQTTRIEKAATYKRTYDLFLTHFL